MTTNDARPCPLVAPADFKTDANTYGLLLAMPEHSAEEWPTLASLGTMVEEDRERTKAAGAKVPDPVRRTRILGPWSTVAFRDHALHRLPEAVQRRMRAARYGGSYYLEEWPAPGDGVIVRAWPPPVHHGGALPDTVWAPTVNYSSRNGVPISGIVVHETEGSYEGAVSWLRNPEARASAHIVLAEDGQRAAQLVRFVDKAWHASAANAHTLGLEMAGMTGTANNPRQLAAAARIVAYWCHHFAIHPHQGDDQGWSGIVRHRDLTGAANPDQHGDPGGFDWPAFLLAVQREIRAGNFPASWGR